MSALPRKRTALGLCVSALGALLLSGCSTAFDPSSLTANKDSAQTPIGEIQGSVHGGQSPVTGAQIYLLAAGTGGYGTASTSLILSGKSGVTCNTNGALQNDCYVLTDANGNFTLSSSGGPDYTCTPGTQVYVVAVGGNPGMGGTVNNTAIVQMAGLGPCPTAGNLAAQVPYLVINEVTTVDFAYAMGGFGTDAFHIASSGTAQAQAGIANAMLNSLNIVGIGWGGALANASGNSNSVAPQSKINALASIVATCVNTISATSSQCSNFFSKVPNSSGTQPNDEATALFNMAHNPVNNAAPIWNLWQLLPAQRVFPTTMTAAPPDWAMPVVYNGVVTQPTGMAMDGNGDVWISDSSKKAVVRIGSLGGVSSFTNGGSFGAMAGVAVNPVTGKIWASDSTNNKVYVLDTTGTVLTTITTGTLNKPAGIAFDRAGNGYVVNSNAYVIGEYNSSGSLVQTLSYPTTQGFSSGIAVDYSGDVFTSPGTGNAGVGVVQAGTTTGAFYAGSSGGGANYLALDATSNTPVVQAQYWTAENNVWTMTNGGVGWRYYLFSQSYAFGGVVNSNYVGNTGGMTAYSPYSTPGSIALDGAGSLWVANTTPGSGFYPLTGVSVGPTYNLTGMSPNGFSTGAASGVGAYMATPDASGNVWVANNDGTVSQMLGMATPVATPLVPGKFATTP